MSSGRASCLRTSGVVSLGVGLATIQVIRSGIPPPLQKKKKKKEKRNHCLIKVVPASENGTLVLFFFVSCFVLVSFIESFRVSKAGNLSSVKGHCTGVYIRP